MTVAPMLQDAEPGGMPVGTKLRHTRLMKGLTLKQLAEAARCSESLLSKIENGRANPSLRMIQRIASALGITIGELFAEDDDPTHVVARFGHRMMIETDQVRRGSGTVLERLIPYAPGHLLQGNIHHIEPGGGSDGELVHEGEDFGYVLEGEVELLVAGRSYMLRDGDSFCFRSSLPHAYRNRGGSRARILWLNTPPTF